jgi:predicted esterase
MQMTDITPLHITVPKTARYYMLGEPSGVVRDVWIACHGYGQLAAQFAEPFQEFIDTSRLIVVPEALSRFYSDTKLPHTAASPVGATWMTREDREAEIVDQVVYMDTLYDRVFGLLAEHGVSRDMTRVHALGFSQGVPTVARWAERGAATVDLLVLWAGGLPRDVNFRAVHERLPALRCDMVYGTADAWITPKVVVEQEGVLAASGIPYRILPFDGGHSLKGGVLRELMQG